MKGFFKQYSYNIVRDLLNQFAISIFGASLSMATATKITQSKVLPICVSVFAIVFYLFLVYTTIWEIGSKDRVSVDVGKKPYRPHTGLLISAIANIPRLIIAILFTVLFLMRSVSFADNVRGILVFISLLFNGMYTGLMISIDVAPNLNLFGQWWIYFVIIIPALVTSWIAYYAGFKNFRLLAPLFDRKNKKK